MESTILTNVSIEELNKIISRVIRDEFEKRTTPEQPPEFITRQEASKLLGISLPTLHFWTRDGKIPAYRISNRIRYKKAEVIDSLNKVRI